MDEHNEMASLDRTSVIDLPEPSLRVKNSDIAPVKKEKNTLKIIAILICVLDVIVGSILGTYYYFSRSKNIYNNVLKMASTYLANNVETNYTTVENNYKLKFNVESNEENIIAEFLNKLDFNLNSFIDFENKKAYFDVDTKYNKKNLLKLSSLVLEDKLYVDLDDLYDKKVVKNIDYAGSIFDTFKPTNDTNLIDPVLKAIQASLKDEYFSTKTSHGFNNCAKLTLNSIQFTDLKIDVLTALYGDKEFMDTLADKTKVSTSVLKTLINSKIGGYRNEKKLYLKEELPINTYMIAIYTKGFFHDLEKIEAVSKASGNKVTLKLDEENINVELDYNNTKSIVNINMKSSDSLKEYKVTVDSDYIKMSFDYSVTTTYNKKDTHTFKTDDSVNYEDLAEEDILTIIANLGNKEALNDILGMFLPTENNMEDII